jgi:hypothetical protein
MPAARVVSFAGLVGTPRILPTATADFNIASLFNVTGSGVLVAIRSLEAQMDSASVTFGRFFSTQKVTTAPTAGTLHTPMGLDTNQTHNANVEFRSGASADGVATALTSAGGPIAWREFANRAANADSQYLWEDAPMFPALVEDDPAILRPGEGVLVRMEEVPSTASGMIVNCMFEEFTYASGDPDVLAVSPSSLNFTWTL